MELDELSSKQPDDPLVRLARQDLDPFSVDELRDRVALLEHEIARSRAKMNAAVRQRASADALFKR
nr:DUF1192 domain-containing protein [Sphingomonas bacterium]